ncbi:hypothetical protein BJ085DRAFT_39423 [Dimargaris cristalligena]|uniref:Uncharacterized protein n=1 Tax=Dimargaris cristalligena TaxID=215637 RepID=A0A4P9ZZC8_9FUNG|nr:hypothetical protein BJ085DRAFT_39423 [Dimargaris cristalligena]|eukprot:RKP39126.1 hypothetical protein BJ085DRAFT_39423 [Dimargaris cristalligena]
MRTVLWCALLVTLIGSLTVVPSQATAAESVRGPTQSSADEKKLPTKEAMQKSARQAHKFLNTLHRVERGRKLKSVDINNNHFHTKAGFYRLNGPEKFRKSREAIQEWAVHSRREKLKQQTLGSLAHGADRFALRYGSNATPSTATTTPWSRWYLPAKEKNTGQPSLTQRVKQQTVGRAANWAGKFSDRFAGYDKNWQSKAEEIKRSNVRLPGVEG